MDIVQQYTLVQLEKLLETAISTGTNLAFQSAYFCLQNALKFTYVRLDVNKFSEGNTPGPPLKGKGKDREWRRQNREERGKDREGREGKGEGEGRVRKGRRKGGEKRDGIGGEGLRHCSWGGLTPLDIRQEKVKKIVNYE